MKKTKEKEIKSSKEIDHILKKSHNVTIELRNHDNIKETIWIVPGNQKYIKTKKQYENKSNLSANRRSM